VPLESSTVKAASFGALLRSLRLAAGLTQEELAERAGLTDRAIRRLEADPERRPQLHTVRLVAQALGLSEAERSRLLAAARPAEGDGAELTPPSLPLTLTPLIGREDDAALMTLLLRERRLVTVCGTGGVGKTRLALEIGRQMAGAFGRITFVELAALRDPGDMIGAIASALALHPQTGSSLLEVVAGSLREGRTLLILDNFEHLLGASPQVLDLLAACPQLTILVTSREALHVRGERVYTLAPLPLPERETDIPRSPAVRLFLERAADAGAAVDANDDGLSAAAEICRRLDGLPLAIELAAAWTPVLSPPALLAGLATRLPYLERGPRDAPARQKTMRSALDWSYSLLSAPEQALFARLSVFAGGWTVEAAAAVCDLDGELDLLARLTALVAKSLVQQGDGRFAMLETIRQFALETLAQRGEEEPIQAAHARYFLQLAEGAEPELLGPHSAEWLLRLDRELDNLRAALARLLERGRIEEELHLASLLFDFWRIGGHWGEGLRWLQEGLGRGGTAAGTVRARALGRAGALTGFRGEPRDAMASLEEALALTRRTGDRRESAWVLRSLGMVEAWANIPSAAERIEESLQISRELGDSWGVAHALMGLGNVAEAAGDYPVAESYDRKALDLFREVGDQANVALSLNNLGCALIGQGKHGAASAFLEESIGLYRELGIRGERANVLDSLGSVYHAQSRFEQSAAAFAEALTLSREMGDTHVVLAVLEHMVELAAEQGEIARAARLAGAAAAARDATELPAMVSQQAHLDETLSRARASLGAGAFERAWEEGRGMTLEAAVAYALEQTAP
jgi:predicted ATPase/DNA-binding XRE family transcriptional regulator